MEENQQQNPSPKWQQDVMTKLVFASLNEQRRARRWSNFFKAVFAGYLFFILFMFMFPIGDSGTKKLSVGKHTALVDVNGVIAAGSDASADRIVTGLRRAFEDENTKGVILRINSPGGSPVQSDYVNGEIQRLREKHPEIKVYAVIVDLCASGGYYIASAADEIYANKASLVGSIGVVMNGFGFVDAIEKLGVERRLYTAGENKGFLDPFSPQREQEVEHVQSLLKNIHQQFIDVVKTGRGDKIKNEKELFSGLVWTGEQSLALGLVDGFGSSSYVARELIKAEHIVNFTPRATYWERFADRLGASMATKLAEILDINALSLR